MSLDVFLENALNFARNTPTDINEHIPTLLELGRECDTIIEMGVRSGMSTRAFMNTGAKLTCYDIVLNQRLVEMFKLLSEGYGRDVSYIEADVLKIEIPEVDLLFIDTLHTNRQLRQELRLHGNKARKYLAFHDTQTFGTRDERMDGQYPKKPIAGEGLLPAIIDFMIDNPHWRFKKHYTNNNGLTVLERCK